MKLARRTGLWPLALVLALRAAALPSDWSHVQTLQGTETGLIKVSLPLETLDAAGPTWPTCASTTTRAARCHSASSAPAPARAPCNPPGTSA